jgi:diadenosine tetraphosphate (Ap4A) HIT family hydrolase
LWHQGNGMDGCVFCEIVAGKVPASVVWRGDGCSAFMDIQPINAGHVLVVPDGHATRLADLPQNAGAGMFLIAQRIAAALYESGLVARVSTCFWPTGRRRARKSSTFTCT